jgi:hypothetical protein
MSNRISKKNLQKLKEVEKKIFAEQKNKELINRLFNADTKPTNTQA